MIQCVYYIMNLRNNLNNLDGKILNYRPVSLLYSPKHVNFNSKKEINKQYSIMIQNSDNKIILQVHIAVSRIWSSTFFYISSTFYLGLFWSLLHLCIPCNVFRFSSFFPYVSISKFCILLRLPYQTNCFIPVLPARLRVT